MTSTFDPELTPAARNAIRVCLHVQPHERVTVVTDRACEEIAASLVAEIATLGTPHRAFVLEEEAPRPLTDLPARRACVHAVRITEREHSSTHIDVVGTEFDIWVDDTPLMRRGAFLVSA